MKELKINSNEKHKPYNGEFSMYFLRFILCVLPILYCYSYGKGFEANQCITINSKLTRLGTDYGGWVIPKDYIDNCSTCYCFGAGEDISFDLSLITYCGATVFSFDPTPRSIAHIEYIRKHILKGEPAYCNRTISAYKINPSDLDKLIFLPLGIWHENEILKFYTPQNSQHVSCSALNIQQTNEYFEAQCKTLSTIMNELGHKKIDLLKLDIEGAEYPVLINMLNEKIFPRLLCVEFHNVKEYSKEELLKQLSDNGYEIIYNNNKTDYTFVYNPSSSD